MRTKIALQETIRKLILAGRWEAAERLMRIVEKDQTYYESQKGIKRLDPNDPIQSTVVSLDEYRRLRSEQE